MDGDGPGGDGAPVRRFRRRQPGPGGRFEKPVEARDLWKHKNLGVFTETITVNVSLHECKILLIKEKSR